MRSGSAGVCAATALISFVLPGRTADGDQAQSRRERKELEEIMKEEAELAGAGLVLAEAQSPPPCHQRTHRERLAGDESAGGASKDVDDSAGSD